MTERAEDPWQLQRALAGDTVAWAKIVDDFSGTMWYWARSQGLSHDDAEDVCQDVWYLLRDKGHTISDPRALPGWLATTTRRQAITVAKRAARATATLTEERLAAIPTAHPAPDDIAVVTDHNERLTAAFHRLRERCQELLSLLWADVSYVDISESLDMAMGSIGETRRRCLEQLRTEAGLS
ncbi:MAG: sigma-70 family RNA polymerase sigma factor [Actinomycetota bacterium]